MTSAATSNESNSNVTNHINVIEQEGDIDDARRQCLGTEAIEQLATGLDLAASTIEEYSQNVSLKLSS